MTSAAALPASALRVLEDARELRRELASGTVDDAYAMRSTFVDFKAHHCALVNAGLISSTGLLTTTGDAALAAGGVGPASAPLMPRAKKVTATEAGR